MEQQAKKRLDQLRQLWAQERETCRRRHIEEREGTALSDRVEQGISLADLHVVETKAAPGERTLLWVEPADGSGLDDFRGGPGAPVLLWWETPSDATSVQAVVARRSGDGGANDKLGVMVDGAPERRLLDGTFHLDQEAPQTTFERGQKAIRTFANAPKTGSMGVLRGVLFGAQPPQTLSRSTFEPFDTALNDAQVGAVDRALASEDIALVHGPPGTGKTRTLVEVVRQCVAGGERVLVTAASNAAVDNMAERLIEAAVKLVRIGHPARVAPSVEARTLDALLEQTADYEIARGWMDKASELHRRLQAKKARGTMGYAERRETYQEARRLRADARGHLRRIQDALLDRAPVICATAAGADSKMLDDLEFDRVVLDEATQAADPIAMVAICRAPRVVMAGDPHQLAPTVIDQEAEAAGLGRTIFERLVDQAVMLEVQHRMHEELMAFPSRTKYEGKLVAAEPVRTHTLDELDGVVADPARPGPLVFVDTAGKGFDEERSEDDPSTRNPGQAQRTVAEVRRLLSRGVSPEDVAVITPYYAQVRELRDLLSDVTGLEIDTVDGFQGREKEAVVVDLVRSNPEGQLGFLTDTRRMNVALTRARRFLLVVGDSATLGDHPYYDAFLEAVEQTGTWMSAWTDEAEPLG